MKILHTDTVDIYRLADTGSQEEYGDDPVLVELSCQIVPASEDIIAIYGGGQVFSLYEIYFDQAIDLETGDKIVSGAKEYFVRDAPMKVESSLLTYTRVIGGVAV
jgi:hypothetical protein